jgi:hypothetical protein
MNCEMRTENMVLSRHIWPNTTLVPRSSNMFFLTHFTLTTWTASLLQSS